MEAKRRCVDSEIDRGANKASAEHENVIVAAVCDHGPTYGKARRAWRGALAARRHHTVLLN